MAVLLGVLLTEAVVTCWGDEAQVTRRLLALLATGATEPLVSPVAAGADKAASTERALALLGQLGRG